MDCASLDEYVNELPYDDNDGTLIQKLADIDDIDVTELSFCVELPSRVDLLQLISLVNRWLEIVEYFHKSIRVYVWSVNTTVEDNMQQLVCKHEKLHMTVLPYFSRKRGTGWKETI